MNLMFVGADGVGKSTIVSVVRQKLEHDGIPCSVKWLRFNQYFGKFFNAISRIIGRSYYKTYEWGKIGYHEYNGVWGKIYILITWIDYLIFFTLVRPIIFRTNSTIIVDRYIIDKIVDLFVDTGEIRLPLFLFYPFVKYELRRFNVFNLICDKAMIEARRPDIIDDKKYDKKTIGYLIVRRVFGIRSLNTGKLSIDEIGELAIRSIF